MCNCKSIRIEDLLVKRDREYSVYEQQWEVTTRPGFYHKACGRELSTLQCLEAVRVMCRKQGQLTTETRKKVTRRQLDRVCQNLVSTIPEGASYYERERLIGSAARKIGWTQSRLYYWFTSWEKEAGPNFWKEYDKSRRAAKRKMASSKPNTTGTGD